MFTGHCVHRRFLGILRLVRPRLSPRPLPLFTVVAPLLWFLGRSLKRRQPSSLPLPFRVESGWAAKVWCSFRRTLAAAATPVTFTRVPGASRLDRVPPLLQVGFACLRFRALTGSWSRILGVARPKERIPHLLQGFPSSPHSHPDMVSDMRAVSLRSLALCQVALEMLTLAALEIVLDQGPSLSSNLFLVGKVAVA